MEIIRFYDRFPKLAEKETRSMVVIDEESVGVPEGRYGFEESYCCDKKCDCRRVYINVTNLNGDRFASIGFGWEDLSFYEEWAHGDQESAVIMKGPSLELGQIQRRYANRFLELFESRILSDEAYDERLKRHYDMLKNYEIEVKEKQGRNEICLCGSGKKYKKCCIWK